MKEDEQLKHEWLTSTNGLWELLREELKEFWRTADTATKAYAVWQACLWVLVGASLVYEVLSS